MGSNSLRRLNSPSFPFLLKLKNNSFYHRYLTNSIDYELFEILAENQYINPNFKSLEKWVNIYLGPATAEYHGISSKKHSAVKDENRNAIIPQVSKIVDGKQFYLSIKGCGAQEDMFFGGKLTNKKLEAACRDPDYLDRIKNVNNKSGFIMGESWMGESPYGAQGFINGFDELNFSSIANRDSDCHRVFRAVSDNNPRNSIRVVLHQTESIAYPCQHRHLPFRILVQYFSDGQVVTLRQ